MCTCKSGSYKTKRVKNVREIIRGVVRLIFVTASNDGFTRIPNHVAIDGSRNQVEINVAIILKSGIK